MSKRCAFNGGEISPEMALRSDMDVYTRACSKLLNFDVSQMGGIKRRRGMRPLASLPNDDAVLLPYTYSESHVYLVELHADSLIVRDREGMEVASFTGGDGSWSFGRLERVSPLQINSLLLLASPDTPVMQLKQDSGGVWTFGEYEYKMPPWYTVDAREHEVTVTPIGDNDYRVAFHEDELADEAEADAGDILRASYFTAQQEAFAKSRDLRAGVQIVDAILPSSTFRAGNKIAIHGDTSCSYWVCNAENGWLGERDFVAGLTLPANYNESFIKAEDMHGFDSVQPIYRLDGGMNFKRGDKLAVQSGYWEYYTCIRDFSAENYRTGKGKPGQYPAHFVRGLAVGEALASKGTWNFYCSGAWVGSYEVRRCYDGTALDLPWEVRGESFSRIGSTSNEQISGDEEEEECWLRLFLTRSQYVGLNELDSGFPPDTCGNRLIVSSYVHDMLLHCRVLEDEAGRDVRYADETPVKLPLDGDIITANWSWAAFSARYGYPAVALLHESRLIFAATDAQPQTLWFSATDDLNNFTVGELDSSGMLLTMATSTQAGICWASSRGDIIMLGTEGGEWCIKGTDGGALTAQNIRITNYGYHGSAHVPAVLTSDNVLYVERGAGRVYQYGYNYDSNSYVSRDMTVFAPHIALSRGGIVRGTELRKPDHKAVFVMGNGSLALMTVNTLHNVSAWHTYETQGRILSVCALPDGQNEDRLYLLVERAGERYLEVMDSNSPYEDGVGLDYTSTMETTAFSIPQANDRKVHASTFDIFLAESCQNEGVTVSVDGEGYKALDATQEPLPRGWVSALGEGQWTQTPLLGISCKGNRGLHILAVQV